MSILLRKTAKELVEKTRFYGDSVSPDWSTAEREFLAFCLDQGILMPGELSEMLKSRLLLYGSTMIDWLKAPSSERRWPDHAPCSPALAFVLRGEYISKSIVNRIDFDHGQTRETFCDSYPEDIVQLVMDQVAESDYAT